MSSIILNCLILVWMPNFLQADDLEQRLLRSPAGRAWIDAQRFEDSEVFVELRASPDGWRVSIADVRGANPVNVEIFLQDEPLVLPAETKIGVTGSTFETLQAFSYPTLGIDEDLVPGLKKQFGLEPLIRGVHDGTCGNFCGQVQGSPLLTIEVVEDVSFKDWLGQHVK